MKEGSQKQAGPANLYENLAKNGIFNINNQYKYEQLKDIHIQQVATLVSKSFCDNEPMCTCLGITYSEFDPLALELAEKAAKDGLSVVALNNEQVIACVLSEDITSPLRPKTKLSPKLGYIFALLEELSAPFVNGLTYNNNHVAHIFMTAVDKNYQGTKLSTKVNLAALEFVSKKNFDFIYCEFTNPINENFMKHINSKKVHTIHYKDFQIDNIKPFSILNAHATSYIFSLKPEAILTYRTQSNEFVQDNSFLTRAKL